MDIIDIEQNQIVKKSNNLIKAKGSLSSTSQKMLAMLIAMIRKDDTEFQKYALHIDSYKKEVGITNKETDFYLQKALELMRNPFELKEGVWYNWCNKVDIKSIEGYIVFDIHQDLKPYLLQLKENFTQYHLTNVLHLKGQYSPRLYELFIMKWNEYSNYNKNSKSYTFELKIDELRDILKIKNSYRYHDIKRQVIEKAKEDLKKYTNIKFDYKEQKIGKKVDRLIITLKSNNKGSNDYLNNKKAFIEFVRKSFKPTDNNFPNILRETTQYGDLKVDINGKLYFSGGKNTLFDVDFKQADTIWTWLYNQVKNGELELNLS